MKSSITLLQTFSPNHLISLQLVTLKQKYGQSKQSIALKLWTTRLKWPKWQNSEAKISSISCINHSGWTQIRPYQWLVPNRWRLQTEELMRQPYNHHLPINLLKAFIHPLPGNNLLTLMEIYKGCLSLYRCLLSRNRGSSSICCPQQEQLLQLEL